MGAPLQRAIEAEAETIERWADHAGFLDEEIAPLAHIEAAARAHIVRARRRLQEAAADLLAAAEIAGAS